MNTKGDIAGSSAAWGAQYRLTASDAWRIPSARMGRAVTDALVEYAAPVPGMDVLDIASGTGEPAITLAERVGPNGSVAALDQSADLLEIAKKRAVDRGLTNFVAHHADAHTLPFPDAVFDLATCRFGIMFFRDPGGALKELRRVLKPGARACFVVWGPFEQPYWQSMMGRVVHHVGGPVIPPGAADPFSFAVPGSLSNVLRGAGFDTVQEETKTVPWSWPGTPESVWEYARAVAAPLKPLLDRVPNATWPAIHANVRLALEKLYDGEQINFGATVVFASGKKI